MGDHVAVCPEQLLATPAQEPSTTSVEGISASMEDVKDKAMESEDEAALTGIKAECRYCQEEDLVCKMEAPCSCNGTLKYVHRSCIIRWCKVKGDIICEICHQPYHPNYAVTEPRSHDDTVIDIGDSWTIPGTSTQIRSPLVLAERATDRVAAALNDDCNLRNPSRGVLCGLALLLFLTLLILRDAYYYTQPKEDKTSHIVFCVLMIVLAPFYILSWFHECRSLLDDRRERDRTV